MFHPEANPVPNTRDADADAPGQVRRRGRDERGEDQDDGGAEPDPDGGDEYRREPAGSRPDTRTHHVREGAARWLCRSCLAPWSVPIDDRCSITIVSREPPCGGGDGVGRCNQPRSAGPAGAEQVRGRLDVVSASAVEDVFEAHHEQLQGFFELGGGVVLGQLVLEPLQGGVLGEVLPGGGVGVGFRDGLVSTPMAETSSSRWPNRKLESER